MELDGILESLRAWKPGAPGLFGQRLHVLRNPWLQCLSGQLRQRLQEVAERLTRRCFLSGLRRSFARQCNIPRAVEGQVPRQDRHPQQRRFAIGNEPGDPDLGVKHPAVGGMYRMYARFEHRVQLSFLAGNRDAGLVDEDVNAITGLP